MERNTLIISVLGILLLGLGVYSLTSSDAPNPTAAATPTPIFYPVPNHQNRPAGMFKTYPNGSGWVVDPGHYETCRDMPTEPAAVAIHGDAASLILPASFNGERGLVTEVGDKKLVVNIGDEFKVDTNPDDRVKFSSYHPCASVDGLSSWYDPGVDSPFKNGVGGLEFSILGDGDKVLDPDPDNRYMPGVSSTYVAKKKGVLGFRVVERKAGFLDGNSGDYHIKVAVIKRRG